jgi:hypothetical protein
MTRNQYVRLPTARNDWHLMARTARLVLTIPTYTVIGAVSGFVILTLFIASLNLTLVFDLVIGGSLPFADRLAIMLELFPFVGTSFGPIQGALLYLVGILTGVDVAMAVYHFREHGVSVREGGASTVGIVLGALGAGCAACGSAILLGLLSLFGITTSLLFLPLEGLEFAILAVVVLTLSIYWLADGMRGGEINGCPIDL